LLEKDARKRLTWLEIIEHHFFQGKLKARIAQNDVSRSLMETSTDSKEIAKEFQRHKKERKLSSQQNQPLLQLAKAQQKAKQGNNLQLCEIK